MAETVLNPQEQKADSAADAKKQNATLKRVAGIILSGVMILLSAYVLNLQHQNSLTLGRTNDLSAQSAATQASNYRAYVQQYKDTKQQLEETTAKLVTVQQALDTVTAELATTKGMLGQTQSMLAQAQAENTKLKQDLQDIEGLRTAENVQSVPELEAKISALKQKNTEVAGELANVKSELKAFEAEFSNLEEGKSLIVLFQNKINLVKSRMRYLKQEAYFAKIAAQKERDRQESLSGNNGYLWKDGQVNKSGKGFSIDVKMVQ